MKANLLYFYNFYI